jgi:hypothetical protein
MKYINFLILLGLVLLFNGCMTTNINFQESSINGIKKSKLNKVSNTSINIKEKEDVFIKKRPDSMYGKATTVNVNMSELNNNSLKAALSQYFNNVNISNNEADIVISSDFLDYSYEYGVLESVKLNVKVAVKVYKNNKLILSKSYDFTSSLYVIASLKISLAEFTEEKFNKTLFELYETKFKPDLLKALEENK